MPKGSKRQAEEQITKESETAFTPTKNLTDLYDYRTFKRLMHLVEIEENDGFPKIVWPVSVTGRKKTIEVFKYTVPMTAASDANLLNEGNLGGKYSATKDKADFVVGAAFYQKPVRALEKNPKTGQPYCDLDAYYALHEEAIRTEREFDRIIHKKLWAASWFDSKGKGDIINAVRVNLVNKKRSAEFKAKKANGEAVERPAKLNPSKVPDQMVANEVILNDKELSDRADALAYEEWYNAALSTRVHLLPWPEEKDSDIANPIYIKTVVDEKTKETSQKETKMGIFFHRPVYERRRVTTDANDFAAKMQEQMMVDRHPNCAQFDQPLLKEVKQMNAKGLMETKMMQVPHVYHQPRITEGVSQSPLKFDPLGKEVRPAKGKRPPEDPNPILGGAMIQVLHNYKINNAPLSVGLKFGQFREIRRMWRGVRSVSEAKANDAGFAVENIEDDEDDGDDPIEHDNEHEAGGYDIADE